MSLRTITDIPLLNGTGQAKLIVREVDVGQCFLLSCMYSLFKFVECCPEVRQISFFLIHQFLELNVKCFDMIPWQDLRISTIPCYIMHDIWLVKRPLMSKTDKIQAMGKKDLYFYDTTKTYWGLLDMVLSLWPKTRKRMYFVKARCDVFIARGK